MALPRFTKVAAAIAAGFLATVVLSVVAATPASAHGYTTNPTSRSLHCKQGTVTNCGAIQWEPQSVEGPKGFPSAGPRDGALCAGGDSRWAPLDDQRGGTGWPSKKVSAGTFTFSWHFTAAHATTKWEYFITKPGWNQTAKLTRSALDLTPFLTVPYGGQRPPWDISHSGNLPSRSGHHVIFAVWTIADTGNAFYQCSDVTF
ncbi:lytic polysaccharide monooxygenase auxiliary activity family 9 protein [Stackebrandtia nassauensis]|uniref:Chitin-binding domain 3 protein n=1 Tax=Stackebrandtia nassauensis (strain DSM 44728 / CIP 108903 / NRRL B-16338 / NBRC 102104 / LLR-40K-21) TaxID=446470 RepID=D3Q763_STANL|nr:lytic polysaccharide monooxygenase [Stackebrandtia nassauensis]ADD42334.1 chitin-binding domain 3 protein [Stackebrandtia nassauensis DSM 44728]